jgi:hypothetical protein
MIAVGHESYPTNQKEQCPDKTQGDVKCCQICDEERFATVKCLNCEDYLCKQCHEYHTKDMEYRICENIRVI